MGKSVTSARLGALIVGAVVALTLSIAPTPASADEGLTEIAQQVAKIRVARDAATETAQQAADVAQAAQDRLDTARVDLATAQSDLKAAKQRARTTADNAYDATIAEGDAATDAASARSEMVQIAREAYMAGSANTELAAFVDFAAVGPSALNGLASHNIAADRIEHSIVGKVEQTGAQAEVAASTADGARQAFANAEQTEEQAKTALESAQDELITAKAAAKRTAARSQRATDDLTKLGERFTAAQETFQEVLAASGGSAAGVTQTPSVSAGNQAQLVWDIMIAEGFTPESAAGVLGNFQQESNIDPTVTQNGGPGMGLAQWSRGGRWDNGSNSLLAFAGSRGLDPWSAVTQTKFMLYEMDNVLSGFDTAGYKKMTDVLAATVYFHDKFEGSADSAAFVRSTRGGYSLHWYQTLTASAPE